MSTHNQEETYSEIYEREYATVLRSAPNTLTLTAISMISHGVRT